MRTFRLLILFLTLISVTTATARKKYPVIRFEQTTIDLGTFSQDDAVQTCTFKFRNAGNAKLVINYVHTSCGCTVADYPKDFISPGGTGEIRVTYDGSSKMPARFRKSIQVFTNCKETFTRLFIEGEMSALPREALHKNK